MVIRNWTFIFQGSESADDDDVESDDGAAQSGVLKKVAFPDIQKEAQPATLCPKVTKCISKRLDKLKHHMNRLDIPSDGLNKDVCDKLLGVIIHPCVDFL